MGLVRSQEAKPRVAKRSCKVVTLRSLSTKLSCAQNSYNHVFYTLYFTHYKVNNLHAVILMGVWFVRLEIA